ncbi:AraC family transcriptional regulator [Spongiibacter taiwanensis]
MNTPGISVSNPIAVYQKACRSTPLAEHATSHSDSVRLCSWDLRPMKQVRIPQHSALTIAVHLGGVRRVRVFTENGISHRFSKPGDITLVPQNQSIKYFIDGPVNFATLHLTESAQRIFGDDCGQLLLKMQACLFALRDDYVMASVRNLLAASSLPPLDFQRYTDKVLESLAWHLLRVVSDRAAEGVRLAAPGTVLDSDELDFAAIAEEIDMRLGDRLHIQELADKAGLGRTAFCERFTEHFGLPPHRYIIEKRIEAAKERLLLNGSVTEVAYDLGFSSASHFSSTFKSLVGLTPRAYLNGQHRQ